MSLLRMVAIPALIAVPLLSSCSSSPPPRDAAELFGAPVEEVFSGEYEKICSLVVEPSYSGIEETHSTTWVWTRPAISLEDATEEAKALVQETGLTVTKLKHKENDVLLDGETFEDSSSALFYAESSYARDSMNFFVSVSTMNRTDCDSDESATIELEPGEMAVEVTAVMRGPKRVYDEP